MISLPHQHTPMKHKLRFRQVHLDFHTSPAISEIGNQFDKRQWQETLRLGNVNSITCFSKCHHGWSYHPTGVGRMHPHLQFDLLKAQFEACKEIDINVPVYLSAGIDNLVTQEHPEWRELAPDGRLRGWSQSPIEAGFHKLCFNTPYLDYLCRQIEEAVTLFPDCDGIFLDIIQQSECCCNWCLFLMSKEGLDATKSEDRKRCVEIGLARYYHHTTAAAKIKNANMPVFHNSGNIARGKHDILPSFSHLELESLPTGGWGYDHFPLSAKYSGRLGLDYLGMTGKFHTTWGEFGGYKHPNALRYECAAMLAFGAKCSVGDQLHPIGELDRSTYEIIGKAYEEVAKKEPWCDDVENYADIALLSAASVNGTRMAEESDVGATRILLEGHFLFDVIDSEMDFSRYKLLILPDCVQLTPSLKEKIAAYLSNGGRLFLSGSSGISPENQRFEFNVGATYHGQSEFQPDYVQPVSELAPVFAKSPLVMYVRSQRIKAVNGHSLGKIVDPYFNRDYRHFCSHQHAPPNLTANTYDCGTRTGNTLYLAHPIFTLYRSIGSVTLKDYVINCLNLILGDGKSIGCNLPSTARLSVMWQPGNRRHIIHLLHANTVNRGGEMSLLGGTVSATLHSIEIIEDLLPLHNITLSVRLPQTVSSVTLEPQGAALPFEKKDGLLTIDIKEFTCHQMVVLHH